MTWLWVRLRQGLYVNPTPSEAQDSIGLYRISITADRLTVRFADLEITRHCVLRTLQRCDPGSDIDRMLYSLHRALEAAEMPEERDFQLQVDPGIFRLELKSGIDPQGRTHVYGRAVTFLHCDQIPED